MANQRTGAIVIAGILLGAALAAFGVVRVMLSFEKEHQGSLELPAAKGEVTPQQLAGLVDRGDNAVWVSDEYWAGPPPARDPGALIGRLKARGVQRAYLVLRSLPHTGAHSGGDAVPDLAARLAFLVEAHRLDPRFEFLVALPSKNQVGRIAEAQGKADDTFLAGLARQFVEAGAAGVQLSAEDSSDPALLPAVRKAMPPGAILSREVLPSVPDALTCGGANEVVLRAFDLGVPDPATYQKKVEGWTVDLARTLGTADAGVCQWRIGLSGEPQLTPLHDPKAESFERGLLAIRGTFAQRELPEGFRGVAIWGEWAMGIQEWALFDAAWRGAKRVTLPPPERLEPDAGTR